MRAPPTRALSVALALTAIGAAGDLVRAQTGAPEYSRQKDVIYGRKCIVDLLRQRGAVDPNFQSTTSIRGEACTACENTENSTTLFDTRRKPRH
jgi:hypothetical protein